MAKKTIVGDRVRIKSLDWYNGNKDEDDNVVCLYSYFDKSMSEFCDKIVTIKSLHGCPNVKAFRIIEDNGYSWWSDDMIEGLVEEESDDCKKCGLIRNSTRCLFMDNCLHNKQKNIIEVPEDYVLKDENGNIINATKIVLEKANTLKIQSNNMETETHRGYCTTEVETTNESKKVAWFTFWGNDFADKVELDLSDRELIQEDGKWFVVKKKKEYPKTYEECCKVFQYNENLKVYPPFNADIPEYDFLGLFNSLETLRKLLICRDAYWKIAGEEMGLGKPWKPGGENTFGIFYDRLTDEIEEQNGYHGANSTLEFPSAEMRDAFYENFKELIESVKELL